MTALFLSLTLVLGQPDKDIKIILKIDPAKPVADGKTAFQVVATVTDAKGQPVVGETIRFYADGYSRDPDGKVIGDVTEMKYEVNYLIIMCGGFFDGAPQARSTTTVAVKTDEKGIAKVKYMPVTWADFMEKIPTRVTASRVVNGQLQSTGIAHITFTKPKN